MWAHFQHPARPPECVSEPDCLWLGDVTWYGGGGGRLFLLEKRGRTVYGPNIPYAIERSPESECWHTPKPSGVGYVLVVA